MSREEGHCRGLFDEASPGQRQRRLCRRLSGIAAIGAMIAATASPAVAQENLIYQGEAGGVEVAVDCDTDEVTLALVDAVDGFPADPRGVLVGASDSFETVLLSSSNPVVRVDPAPIDGSVIVYAAYTHGIPDGTAPLGEAQYFRTECYELGDEARPPGSDAGGDDDTRLPATGVGYSAWSLAGGLLAIGGVLLISRRLVPES